MKQAVRALMSGAVDYAGLFPPAALDLERTVANFEQCRSGADAWALGRLVLPATRLAEFADRWPERLRAWPISLLLGGDFDAEMRFAVDTGLPLDSIECRPASLAEVEEIRRRMSKEAVLFVECPAGAEHDELLAAARDAGACAKLRMGGTVPEAIPETRTIADFLVACVRYGVRMKATAGLHHAFRGRYTLTYATDSSTAIMHGFVNFYIAAIAALQGDSAEKVERILADEDRASFSASDGAVRWRDRSFSKTDLHCMRERLALSMGSCSFDEPVDDLRAMGWME